MTNNAHISDAQLESAIKKAAYPAVQKKLEDYAADLMDNMAYGFMLFRMATGDSHHEKQLSDIDVQIRLDPDLKGGIDFDFSKVEEFTYTLFQFYFNDAKAKTSYRPA